MAQSHNHNDFEENIIQDQAIPKRKKRRRRSKAGKIFLWVVVIIAAACFLSLFILQTANDVFGFGKVDRQIEIVIAKGMSTSDISALLKKEDVIQQQLTFRMYSMLRNKDGVMQAGNYILNSNMGYDQIISALKTGDTIKEEVKITFYEGMSAVEIAALLEEKKICGAAEFLAAVTTGEYGFEFEDMIPDDDLRYRNLEGYLFPDTYDFWVGENVDSVVKKFLRNFQKRVFPELYQKIQDSGMTLDEAVTLASIIQEEASLEDQMSTVSSVFHNRIENTGAGLPKLQSDVTIFYVENDIKPYLTRTNQAMYDAYNTYVRDGLPIGPICSPGVSAIKAAVTPTKTNYYFFVTDKEGKYYYSKTLDEHKYNVRKANAVGGSHGTDVS